jgi:hypothetical protein
VQVRWGIAAWAALTDSARVSIITSPLASRSGSSIAVGAALVVDLDGASRLRLYLDYRNRHFCRCFDDNRLCRRRFDDLRAGGGHLRGGCSDGFGLRDCGDGRLGGQLDCGLMGGSHSLLDQVEAGGLNCCGRRVGDFRDGDHGFLGLSSGRGGLGSGCRLRCDGFHRV